METSLRSQQSDWLIRAQSGLSFITVVCVYDGMTVFDLINTYPALITAISKNPSLMVHNLRLFSPLKQYFLNAFAGLGYPVFR
jgi:hypothetical protein